MKPNNTKRDAEIVRRRHAGERPAYIWRAMGVSRSVVAGVLQRAGLADPTSPYSHRVERPRLGGLSPRQVSEIRARRAAGETLVSIAPDYGVHFTTISRIARDRFKAYAA